MKKKNSFDLLFFLGGATVAQKIMYAGSLGNKK